MCGGVVYNENSYESIVYTDCSNNELVIEDGAYILNDNQMVEKPKQLKDGRGKHTGNVMIGFGAFVYLLAIAYMAYEAKRDGFIYNRFTDHYNETGELMTREQMKETLKEK